MQDFVGQQIDRYRVTERLGMGGMAVVYKAYDTRLERDVAIKLIRTTEIPESQHDRLMKRFEREAKAQARFNHRHIVPVHDYGEVNGAPFLVMAHISGGTLKVKTGKPVDWQQAVRWLIPIADALQYAHKRGIIHRDIKPSNILFDEEDQPVLTDFGIAKLLETDDASLTGTGLGVGTPEYMAPEQWQGKASPATDQYALGVVLYELLTGEKPYSAVTPAAIILMQATEPLRSPRALAPGIPESVETLLYKALAKDPQDRYTDMSTFQRVLEKQLTGEPVQADKSEATNLPDPGPVPAESEPVPRSEAETVDELARSPIAKMPVEDLLRVKRSATPHLKREPQIGDEYQLLLPSGVTMDFVYVPAGEFWMGATKDDKDAIDCEKPQHKVYLDGYWIGKHPVTNEQYRAFVKHGGGEEPGCINRFNNQHKHRHPVVGVNWHQAEKFCQWLSQHSGERVYLPTEAQWEKAARGTDGRRYPWGDRVPTPQLANYDKIIGDTTSVGSYPSGASPYGALDMAGNVWEWVVDWYAEDYYSRSPAENPTGPTSGEFRVLRGGSWDYNELFLRVSSRLGYIPD